MKDTIWLSPSLAAGAIAARLVVFFERPLHVGISVKDLHP